MDRVLVIPYAGLGSEHRVGIFVFWPWADASCRAKYIPDVKLRGQVSQEVERHVDWWGRPIGTQCLVSVASSQGWHLAGGHETGLAQALAFLAFSYLIPPIRQSPPIPEHFQAFSMPLFAPGKPYPLASGGLHDLLVVISPDGASSLRFQRPREVDGCKMSQRAILSSFEGAAPCMCEGISPTIPDADMLRIGTSLLSDLTSPMSQRAFRAIRWHNLSMRQDEVLDPGQRPVALCTAFEILLSVGGSTSKVKPICGKIDELISLAQERRFTVRERKPLRLTRNSYVIYKLFKWRNKVVHGEEYGIRDGTIWIKGWDRRNLVLIASRIFGRCIKRLCL